MRLPSNIVGNEENVTINVKIQLISTRDIESDTSNNDLIGGPITIQFDAIADLSITSLYVYSTVQCAYLYDFFLSLSAFLRLTHLHTEELHL